MPTAHSSAADAGDQHRRLTAIAALALAVHYASTAASLMVRPEAAGLLDPIAMVAAGGAVLFILPIAWWKLKQLRPSNREKYRGTGGFSATSFARAQSISWGATFLVLVAASVFNDRLTSLPLEALIDMVLALMLAILSTTFLTLEHSGGDDGE